MKLVRFCLDSDTRVRSGILFGEEVLETDGVEAIGRYPASHVRLLSAIGRPPSFRDFQGFESHVLNVRKRHGRDNVPPEWYEAPIFFFQATSSIVGPDEYLLKPEETQELDFELEVGVVIREGGENIGIEEADDQILGFVLVNDWSARDLQRRESRLALGPAKGKDFATGVGAYLVTPEELAEKTTDTERGKRYNLDMRAFLNGELVSQNNLGTMYWTFAEMISYASRNCPLLPGDLIASGCCGTGCLLERGTEYLEAGDEVLLEVDGLGSLSNYVTEHSLV